MIAFSDFDFSSGEVAALVLLGIFVIGFLGGLIWWATGPHND